MPKNCRFRCERASEQVPGRTDSTGGTLCRPSRRVHDLDQPPAEFLNFDSNTVSAIGKDCIDDIDGTGAAQVLLRHHTPVSPRRWATPRMSAVDATASQWHQCTSARTDQVDQNLLSTIP